MKTMNDVTLYDLMAEDVDVWLTKSKDFGFDLQIDDEEGSPLIDEKGIHPYAIDSFAALCRSFLSGYERACAKISEAA